MTEPNEQLPASKIVEQFGDEIKAAIAAVAAEAPKAAKREAKIEARNESRKGHVQWYLISLGMAILVAFAVSYFMLNYAPRSHAVDITFQRPDLSDVCSRSAKLSTEAHPIYLCNAR